MKRKFALTVVAVLLFSACATTPFTQRSQLRLINSNELNAMAFSQYDSFLKENKTVNSGSKAQMVKRVGKRIQLAAENYYRQIGQSSLLEGYEWEFNLVDENTVNAWAMPGGKVVIYTGILPITKNEDGLAVVMGHEIAHALANHGNERMSQGMLAQGLGTGLSVAMREKPAAVRQLAETAFGFGAQAGVMLPFSRKHESEADEIGLYLMAMAGYNPEEAAPFWQRMAGDGGNRPPAFLSTHPEPTKRSETLKSLIPKAKEYAAKYPVR